MIFTLRAADIAGIRAIFVHAKDERARTFYERFGFEPSPIHPLQLMLLIKDIKKTASSIRAHRSKRSSRDARSVGIFNIRQPHGVPYELVRWVLRRFDSGHEIAYIVTIQYRQG